MNQHIYEDQVTVDLHFNVKPHPETQKFNMSYVINISSSKIEFIH